MATAVRIAPGEDERRERRRSLTGEDAPNHHNHGQILMQRKPTLRDTAAEFFTGSPSYSELSEVEDRTEIVEFVNNHMLKIEFEGALCLERSSVYGAAIALPQVARSMYWNSTTLVLCFRVTLLLALNYVLQFYCIILIGEASQVMDVLAGKMHLCDFGKTLHDCPDGPGCFGPGGTKYTPERLYSFDIWSVRNFVRDSLVTLFPGQKEEIMSQVDPGEYGMENYAGRMMACFLFLLVEVRDLVKIFALGELLWYIPSQAESWVKVDKKAEVEERIKFVVAGIPVFWKLVILVTVIVPKTFLWYSVCWIGIRFLMETSGILNAILGAITMDFILTFDELIYDSLSNDSTRFVMENLQDYRLPHEKKPLPKCWQLFNLAMPLRLILLVILLTVFICVYYYKNCELAGDGTWVSQPMHLPTSTYFSLKEFLMGRVDQHEHPYWTMPPTP